MSTGTDTDNALLSLADVKVYVGSTATTDNDGTLNDLINAVSYRFNAETGRNLKGRTWTEYYDGDGTSELMLRNWPISSTSITITIDETRAFTSTDNVVTSTDVMLDTEMGTIQLDGHVFDSGTRNVKVEYSAGYSTAAAFDITNAAKEYLRLMFDRQTGKGSQIGIRTESYEGVSRTYETDLPWSVKRVLDMYKGHIGR